MFAKTVLRIKEIVRFTLIHITHSIIWDEGDCVSKWADFLFILKL